MVKNLIAKDANHLKGLIGSNRVDEHVAMNADEVFGVHDAVFVLKERARQAVDRRLQPAVLGWPRWVTPGGALT